MEHLVWALTMRNGAETVSDFVHAEISQGKFKA